MFAASPTETRAQAPPGQFDQSAFATSVGTATATHDLGFGSSANGAGPHLSTPSGAMATPGAPSAAAKADTLRVSDLIGQGGVGNVDDDSYVPKEEDVMRTPHVHDIVRTMGFRNRGPKATPVDQRLVSSAFSSAKRSAFMLPSSARASQNGRQTPGGGGGQFTPYSANRYGASGLNGAYLGSEQRQTFGRSDSNAFGASIGADSRGSLHSMSKRALSPPNGLSQFAAPGPEYGGPEYGGNQTPIGFNNGQQHPAMDLRYVRIRPSTAISQSPTL